MHSIIDVANGVAAELADLSAAVEFVPDYKLPDLSERKCIVTPVTIEHRNVSRVSVEYVYYIEVSLLHRSRQLDYGGHVDLMTAVGSRFLRNKICGMNCVSVEYNPLFAPEQARQRNLFHGVISLSFKGYGNE